MEYLQTILNRYHDKYCNHTGHRYTIGGSRIFPFWWGLLRLPCSIYPDARAPTGSGAAHQTRCPCHGYTVMKKNDCCHNVHIFRKGTADICWYVLVDITSMVMRYIQLGCFLPHRWDNAKTAMVGYGWIVYWYPWAHPDSTLWSLYTIWLWLT